MQQQQKGALISIIRTGVFKILPVQQLSCGVKLKACLVWRLCATPCLSCGGRFGRHTCGAGCVAWCGAVGHEPNTPFISTAGTATLAVIYLWPLARIPWPAVVGNKIEFSVIYELSIFETNIIYQMTEGFIPDPCCWFRPVLMGVSWRVSWY